VVLKAWLIQAIKEKNTQLVRQLLKVIYTLPMTVETLQKSGMGKLIKKLENHPTEVVKKWAVRIMNSWKVSPPYTPPLPADEVTILDGSGGTHFFDSLNCRTWCSMRQRRPKALRPRKTLPKKRPPPRRHGSIRRKRKCHRRLHEA
jgi:hypothetical protein